MIENLRTALAGARFELRVLPRSPGDLMALVTAPVTTIVFLAITQHAGRHDLATYAVLGPALMALWSMALMVCGEMIDAERAGGTFEALVATPARPLPLLAGRIVVVVTVSLLSFAESWLVAALVFSIVVPVPHPGLFVAALLATVLAMAGWASIMASVFVLARSARIFQNSLSFPFYVLGGVMLPVSQLPDWLRPVTRLVFLSWSSDLLRDSLNSVGVRYAVPRIGLVLGFAGVGLLIGRVLLNAVLNRSRTAGTLAYA